MNSAIYYGTKDIKLVKKEKPRITKDNLLIKVMASGICSTDILFYHGNCSYITPPVILGHEYSGEVIEVGEDIKDIKKGDRVAVDPNVFCCKCFYCRIGEVHLCENMLTLGVNRDGGFSQYSLIPSRSALRLEENMTYDEGALLEPVACCIHGLDKLNIQFGDTVILTGSGPIGYIMIQLIKIYGASKIIVVEPMASRRKLAERFGANYALESNYDNVKYITRQIVPNGVDVLVECSGNSIAQENALSLVRKGGKVLFFGCSPENQQISISSYNLNHNEIVLIGSTNNPFSHVKAIRLISSGKINIKDIISHRIALENIIDAFNMVGTENTGKIIITPNS